MGGLPIITPLFLIKSGYKNREIVIFDDTYQNVDLDQYQNWLERKKHRDYRYNFEDEKICSVTQLINENKEKENNIDIT